MVSTTVFGHKCDVQRVFADFLREVEIMTTAFNKGAQGTLRNSEGFVARDIDDPNNPGILSNHAYGLAIDLEPGRNPMILESRVVSALNNIVKERGINYRYDAAAPGQNLEEIISLTKAASNAVQAWLDKYLPEYQRLSKQAEGKGAAADQAKTQLANDNNLLRFATLLRHVDGGLATLENWRCDGIFSLDAALLHAMHTLGQDPMYAKYGFRYGGEYESRKDFMHFEFQREMVFPVPPAKKSRKLEDLFGTTYVIHRAAYMLKQTAGTMGTTNLIRSPSKLRFPR